MGFSYFYVEQMCGFVSVMHGYDSLPFGSHHALQHRVELDGNAKQYIVNLAMGLPNLWQLNLKVFDPVHSR